MNNKLFIASLYWGVTENNLWDAFEPFGNVLDVKIITDRVTNRSKGFGFVTFDNPVDAQKAKEELNGTEFFGRKIIIDFAKETNRPSDGNYRSN